MITAVATRVPPAAARARARWFVVLLGVLGVVVGALLIAGFARAGVVGDFIATEIIAPIILLFVGFVGQLLLMLVGVLISIAKYNGFVNSTAVANGWIIVRDLTNMFFILVLLVLAFGTMLGVEGYSYKNRMLPRLLIMAVVINFSRTICGLLIDFGQVVMLTFVNGFAAAAGGNFVEALGIKDLLEPGENRGGVKAWDLVVAALFALAIVTISLGVVIIMICTLIIRIIYLWLLIILSPLAFFMKAVPGGKASGYYAEWWSMFTSNIVTGPILAFFLWLSLVSVAAGGVTGGFESPTGGEEVKQGASKAFAGANIQGYCISIALLLGGVMMAQKAGGAGVGIGKSIAGGLGKGVAKGIYRASGMRDRVDAAKQAWSKRDDKRKERVREMAAGYGVTLGRAEAGLGRIAQVGASPIDSAGKGFGRLASRQQQKREDKGARLTKEADLLSARAGSMAEGDPERLKLEKSAQALKDRAGNLGPGKLEKAAGIGAAGLNAATYVTQPKKGMSALGERGKRQVDEQLQSRLGDTGLAGKEKEALAKKDELMAKSKVATNEAAAMPAGAARDAKLAEATAIENQALEFSEQARGLGDQIKALEKQAADLSAGGKNWKAAGKMIEARGFDGARQTALDQGNADLSESVKGRRDRLESRAQFRGKANSVVGKAVGEAAEVAGRVGLIAGGGMAAGITAGEVAGRRGGKSMEETGKYVESKSKDFKFREADDARKRLFNSSNKKDDNNASLTKGVSDVISGKAPILSPADLQGAILLAAEKGLAGQGGIPNLDDLKVKLEGTGADQKTKNTFENLAAEAAKAKAAAEAPAPAAKPAAGGGGGGGAPAPAGKPAAAAAAPNFDAMADKVASAVEDAAKGIKPTVNVDMNQVVSAIETASQKDLAALERMNESIKKSTGSEDMAKVSEVLQRKLQELKGSNKQ